MTTATFTGTLTDAPKGKNTRLNAYPGGANSTKWIADSGSIPVSHTAALGSGVRLVSGNGTFTASVSVTNSSAKPVKLNQYKKTSQPGKGVLVGPLLEVAPGATGSVTVTLSGEGAGIKLD